MSHPGTPYSDAVKVLAAPVVVEVDASSPGTYNVLATDDIINVNNVSNSDYTITLPTAAAAVKGKTYTVKDATGSCSSPANINVNVSGGGTIDEATTWVFPSAWLTINVYSNGTAWFRRDR